MKARDITITRNHFTQVNNAKSSALVSLALCPGVVADCACREKNFFPQHIFYLQYNSCTVDLLVCYLHASGTKTTHTHSVSTLAHVDVISKAFFPLQATGRSTKTNTSSASRRSVCPCRTALAPSTSSADPLRFSHPQSVFIRRTRGTAPRPCVKLVSVLSTARTKCNGSVLTFQNRSSPHFFLHGTISSQVSLGKGLPAEAQDDCSLQNDITKCVVRPENSRFTHDVSVECSILAVLFVLN